MSNTIYALAIPKWGIEMETGTITHWHNAVGDTVTKGDELVDIESDKIVNTLEATASGVLRRKIINEDDTLSVGELIGVIADASDSEEAIDEFITDFNAKLKKANGDCAEASTDKAAPVAAIAPTAEAPTAVTVAPAGNKTGKVRVSPPVRRKAEKLGIDISAVIGTGTGGRITSEDIDRIANGDSASSEVSDESASQEFTATKLSSTQQTIGRRLVESKQSVPHFYLSTDIEIDALIAKRAVINSEQAKKVSINDMMVWCTARALQAVPQVNAQLVGDEIRQFQHSDISVAVATERGLFTPVIKAAETMTPVDIANNVEQLVAKAKDGKLARDDIDGGSFTVSNLGMYGITSFDAIINPPQVAILALGKGQPQVVVRDANETAVATIINASLSCDHRVVDGALGGTFLAALKQEIESLN